MSFQWPLALTFLLFVPAVLGTYLWKLKRRRKQAVRYSSVALLRSVIPARSRRRRHIPVAFLLTSVAVLALASSRPQISRTVPFSRTSIILALDVSQSMCSTDVDPNRLTVAQAAARAFVKDQADGTRMGIVIFSGFAQLVVPPTTDRKSLLASIDGLTTARGTAIGSAILKSLDAIAETNPDVAPVGDATGAPPTDVGVAGANGYASDIVVLLTDGANTRGITPLDAVPYAIQRGVRVFTIGFGTATPARMSCSRAQLGAGAIGNNSGGFGGGFGGAGGGQRGGGGFGGGAGSPLVADTATLQKVADQTGGQFYKAEDAEQLAKVFTGLPKDVDLQKKNTEITALFAGLGALLAAAAVVTSIRWSPYP